MHPATTRGRRRRAGLLGVLAVSAVLGFVAAPGAGAAITYQTFFQDPGPAYGQDFSLEARAIADIDATPGGESITFAFRDFNRIPVADALLAAHARGVTVSGVVDGGERNQLAVQKLLAGLGPQRLVVCGAPDFTFLSCIANSLTPSLQHNKFLTFSKLADGREDVVLETSENFLEPTQYSYYNDMVEIAGDHALHGHYVQYVADLQAQVRSDDHYGSGGREGDDGSNTIFLSPRRQRDLDHDDTIVDQLDTADCSAGGTIRVANMAFRSERAVIMRKLVALDREGCDVDVITSTADPDIVAGLTAGGVAVHPFFLRRAGTRPQVLVHDKFFLIDARRAGTGAPLRVTYAGSSNWRADEQYSDDLLLRMTDPGVFAAYTGYWQLIRSRVASEQPNPAGDKVPPAVAIGATPAPNAAGWNRSGVDVRVAASDGSNVSTNGVKVLHVTLSGAQTGSYDVADEHDGAVLKTIAITAEGTTKVTAQAEDKRGNLSTEATTVVRIDKTAPRITGLSEDCVLWPPNRRLRLVADVQAHDAGSGVADLTVTADSDAPDAGDVVIDDGRVWLRAEKGPTGNRRTYVVTASARDVAGNTATREGTCVVPHSRGSNG